MPIMTGYEAARWSPAADRDDKQVYDPRARSIFGAAGPRLSEYGKKAAGKGGERLLQRRDLGNVWFANPALCDIASYRVPAQPASALAAIPLPRVNVDPTALTTAARRVNPASRRISNTASIPVQ